MAVHGVNREGMKVELTSGGHVLLADEPLDVGGTDTGPNPYELLLSALGACKLITMRMYARRKEWPLESAEAILTTHKIHARDCEDCESDPDARIDVVEVELRVHGDLTDEQRERLAWIADRCPVHRTLTSETKIRTTLAQPA